MDAHSPPILLVVAEDNKKRRKRTKTGNSRVTPKGTQSNLSSKRYTPPEPDPYQPSSKWVPIFMFGFFGLGVLIILLNYLPGDLLPGGTDDRYLLAGLGSVCLGFIAATRYR